MSLNFRQLTKQLLHQIISFCLREKKTIHGHFWTKFQRDSSAKQSTANQSGNDDNLIHVATKMDLNWGILRRSWSLKIYVFIVLYMQFCCLQQHHNENNKKCDFARYLQGEKGHSSISQQKPRATIFIRVRKSREN